jgi:uncharacterized protein YcaQ
MPQSQLPAPQIVLSKAEARRFMLAHHKLWPPRTLQGKAGVLDYIQHIGSIQFDPINIVGRNPDLVLQSRVIDYQPEHLDQLLYQDRTLIDGWDKMACIYSTTDWPHFGYRRKFLRENPDPRKPPDSVIKDTLDQINQRGSLSSLDFKGYAKIDWHWGPTKAARAALEYLYSRGYLGVHHRINNRRYFDLIDNLLPEMILKAPDPFNTTDDYRDWHVLRRIRSLGLAQTNSGENWGGIIGVKATERRIAINRLVERGDVTPIAIEDIPDRILFAHTSDLTTLKTFSDRKPIKPGAALIAPLDNLIWNRRLIESLFDFSYRWEVYTPKVKRKYGYYVLPVLYGDSFIARLDPAFDKKKRVLTLQNWWWEPGVKLDESMHSALLDCLNTFCNYLDAAQVVLSESVRNNQTLHWLQNLDRIQ